MKKIFAAGALALLLLSGVSAQAAYDSAQVKEVMHVNFGSLQGAKKAIDAADAKAAAAAFQAIVDADTKLLGMNPPKGAKADWDAAFTALIASATKGAKAAAASDWDGAKAALAELRATMSKGHGAFRG
jgi:cytochrome c556